MSKKNDLVSIIMPSFNSANFISESIISIQQQTYTNWELIITDDCSTDNTLEIIQKYREKDDRIKIFKLTKNSGAGLARNNSIKFSNGKYIAFCDSDDQWKRNKIHIQLDFMIKHNLSFTYSSYDVIDESGNFKSIVNAPNNISYSKMLNNNYVGCLTAIYNKDLLGVLYLNEIRKRQDWALWLFIMKKIKKTQGISESLAIYRDRSNSISSNKLKLLKYNYKIYNKVLSYNHLVSLILVINFLFHYALKKK